MAAAREKIPGKAGTCTGTRKRGKRAAGKRGTEEGSPKRAAARGASEPPKGCRQGQAEKTAQGTAKKPAHAIAVGCHICDSSADSRTWERIN